MNRTSSKLCSGNTRHCRGRARAWSTVLLRGNQDGIGDWQPYKDIPYHILYFRCSEFSVQGSLDELSTFDTLSSNMGSAVECSPAHTTFPRTECQQPLIPEDASSLSEVQALPALILDTSVETLGEDLDILITENEDMENETHDNEDIVWRTSQYYGIDLVKSCEITSSDI